MRIFKNKEEKGFSLVEVLVTISLNLFVVAMIIAVGVSSLRHIRTIRDHRNLYATTSFLNNQFTYWIKQGAVVEVDALDNSILYIRPPGSSTTTIATSTDNRIIINNGAGDEYLTADNIEVDKLVFTKIDHSVRIAFTLNTNGTNVPFSATTTVAQRN